ncbi:MAG: helix-turn-helix domain-containing protein [Pseudomonadota bacterium]
MVDLTLFQTLAACVMLGVLILSVLRRTETYLSWAWIAFCTSATASLLLRGLGDDAGQIGLLLLAPASATCGASWLLARALFREGRPFGAAHLIVVAVIAAVNLSPAGALGAALGNLQDLLASTVIVLTLWEGVRGWAQLHSRAEKAVRLFFLSVTAAAVLVAVVWLRETSDAAWLGDAVETAALLAVSAAAALCVLFRGRHPLGGGAPQRRMPTDANLRRIDSEIRDLGERLDALVRREQLYLKSDLKVADIARLLHAPEYKVTRAITGALRAPNFNQFINRLRVDHARRLMEDDPHLSILAVAFDSGFASIGPFNRAFKAITGRTPRAYRAERGEGSSLAAE